jgi:hypothetical protein
MTLPFLCLWPIIGALTLEDPGSILEVAANIAGSENTYDIIRRLQEQLFQLMEFENISFGLDPLPYFVCPKCGDPHLERYEWIDDKRDDRYLVVNCKKCRWGDSTDI